MPLFDVNFLHRIERDRIIKIRGVERHDIPDAAFGHIVKNGLCELSVRIHDRDAIPRENIRDHHVPQQRGLAGAGLPDYIHMIPAIRGFNAKDLALVAKIRFCKWYDVVFHIKVLIVSHVRDMLTTSGGVAAAPPSLPQCAGASAPQVRPKEYDRWSRAPRC